jgi:Uma2 family endonuclease
MTAPQVAISEPKALSAKLPLLTYEDYARLTPPDSGDYELHNGRIIKMATPVPPHQKLSMRLSSRIFNHIEAHDLGEVYTAPMDTVFTRHNTFQPDILFLSKDRLHLVGDKKIEGAPDLVVEIMSPSNSPKEMKNKWNVYERTAVREYWIVDLDKQILKQYEKVAGAFVERELLQKNDILASTAIEGFELPMNFLFK